MTTKSVTIKDSPVHYIEHGNGIPVLALHGGYVDHSEIKGWLDPIFQQQTGYRRLYPDLPGMGRTPAPASVNSSNDILQILLDFIDEVIGEQPFLLVAHSYGGYLAQGIAAQRPAHVAGVALVCPVMAMGENSERSLPEHVVVHTEGTIEGVLSAEDEAQYRDYFVVQTPETLKRYEATVAPGVALTDTAALERIFTQWELDPPPSSAAPYPNPALILLGRHDSTVGYADQWQLVEQYLRATFAVLDGAGHALPHEQIPLVTALMTEWLARVAATQNDSNRP